MERAFMEAPEAAAYMSRSKSTLSHWRQIGYGPRWALIGKRVAYRRCDIDAWLDEQFSRADACSPESL